MFRQSHSSSSALSEVRQKALTTRRPYPVWVHGHAPMSKVHFKPKSTTVHFKPILTTCRHACWISRQIIIYVYVI
ncbi:hypothetical protein ACFX13_000819 [Malus domestica]